MSYPAYARNGARPRGASALARKDVVPAVVVLPDAETQVERTSEVGRFLYDGTCPSTGQNPERRDPMITKEKADATIASRCNEIAAVDDEITHDVVGVAQAIDDMRKALNEVESCISRRQFEKAADLGYDSVSSGFVFLQRTLGGLHERCMDKTKIVQAIATTLGCAYEEALPHVDAAMQAKRDADHEAALDELAAEAQKHDLGY